MHMLRGSTIEETRHHQRNSAKITQQSSPEAWNLSIASLRVWLRYRDDAFLADMDALDDFRKLLQFETLILRAATDD